MFEVSEMVGYTSQTAFGRNFQKQFGMAPSDYLNLIRNDKKSESHIIASKWH
jgi:AraC-like DNA-binding protein